MARTGKQKATAKVSDKKGTTQSAASKIDDIFAAKPKPSPTRASNSQAVELNMIQGSQKNKKKKGRLAEQAKGKLPTVEEVIDTSAKLMQHQRQIETQEGGDAFQDSRGNKSQPLLLLNARACFLKSHAHQDSELRTG